MCFGLNIVLLDWGYFCAFIMIYLIQIGLGKAVTRIGLSFRHS